MAAFEDAFTDIDGTALDAHTPDIGTGWIFSTTSTNAQINASNQLKTVDGGAKQNCLCDDLGAADHQVWVQFPMLSGNVVNSRICIRLFDTTDYALGVSFNASNQLHFTKRISSSTSTLGTDVTGVSNGEWVRLKVVGDAITWWRASGSEPIDPTQDTNWTAIDSATNSNKNTETRAGLLLFGTSASQTIDDPFIDNFRHNVIPAAGGNLLLSHPPEMHGGFMQ